MIRRIPLHAAILSSLLRMVRWLRHANHAIRCVEEVDGRIAVRDNVPFEAEAGEQLGLPD